MADGIKKKNYISISVNMAKSNPIYVYKTAAIVDLHMCVLHNVICNMEKIEKAIAKKAGKAWTSIPTSKIPTLHLIDVPDHPYDKNHEKSSGIITVCNDLPQDSKDCFIKGKINKENKSADTNIGDKALRLKMNKPLWMIPYKKMPFYLHMIQSKNKSYITVESTPELLKIKMKMDFMKPLYTKKYGKIDGAEVDIYMGAIELDRSKFDISYKSKIRLMHNYAEVLSGTRSLVNVYQ